MSSPDRIAPEPDIVEMPTVLSSREVKERLGVSMTTVYRWTKHDVLRPHKSPGGLLLYPEKDVEQLRLALKGEAEYPYRQGRRKADSTISYE